MLLTTLLYAPALAQSNNLEMLWQSEPGFRPPAGIYLPRVVGFDATGDGKPDLVMTRDDDQGNLRDILVRDTATGETFWRVEDVSTTLGLANIFVQLLGFADVNGDGEREALFTTETEVRAYDPSSNELSWLVGPIYRFLGATDLTGDSHEEIIATTLDAGVVTVWTWPN